MAFFLRGVADVARSASDTAKKIIALRAEKQGLLASERKSRGNLVRALDVLFQQPIVTVRRIEERLDVTFATANAIAARLVELGVLRESTGFARNRRFVFDPYLALFET